MAWSEATASGNAQSGYDPAVGTGATPLPAPPAGSRLVDIIFASACRIGTGSDVAKFSRESTAGSVRLTVAPDPGAGGGLTTWQVAAESGTVAVSYRYMS